MKLRDYDVPLKVDQENKNAHLVLEDERIPIECKCASRYSLRVRFLNGNSYKDNLKFSGFIYQCNGEEIELGPCRLIKEPNIDGYSGLLIFTEDIYDFPNLFNLNNLVKLKSVFSNLPLLLAHKENIKSSFKEYTANLVYDLNVYKTLFDEVDAEYEQEPIQIKNLIQDSIIQSEGREFMLFLDGKITELEKCVSSYTREENERHGFYFRNQLWHIISAAPFMERTNLKPRGYPGDSCMMKMVYRNEYEGNSTFAKLLHKHPLEYPTAEAVRSRRKLISEMLTNIQKNYNKKKDRMTVLSVACGPAIEILDILKTSADCDKYHFTLFDQDRKALCEAATLIEQIEKKLGTGIKVDFLNESVRMVLATDRLTEQWGQFQFVYSMGLFDYLTPPVAKAVLERLFQLMKPGGEMVIGNFHVSNSGKIYMEYLLDWTLYYRSEEEFRELIEGISPAESKILFEDTGNQMFLYLKK